MGEKIIHSKVFFFPSNHAASLVNTGLALKDSNLLNLERIYLGTYVGMWRDTFLIPSY